MSNFREFDRETGFLLPLSLDEWLPAQHLARFVVEVIDGLDLSAMVKSYRGTGSAGYHPALLLGLFGRGPTILKRGESIKRKTIQQRRRLHDLALRHRVVRPATNVGTSAQRYLCTDVLTDWSGISKTGSCCGGTSTPKRRLDVGFGGRSQLTRV